MDLNKLKERFLEFIQKYKYVALILLIGIGLMLLPTGKHKEQVVQNQPELQKKEEKAASEQLADILSCIDGAGSVQVFLTVAAGEQTVYQTNDTITSGTDTNNTQIDTVTITDAQRNEAGLVRQINPPIYQGAIVVCQGADSATVRLAIADAVSKVTGLGTDRISVLKMK